VDIKANASDGPITIEYDNSASLTWVSEYVDSCSASGAWSGDKTLLGSESTGNLTSPKTYTITCVGSRGTVSDSVIVNVDNIPPPAPTVDIKADGSDGPITIDYEESSELTWTSTNAGSCFATGGWSGAKQIIGSERTGDLTYSETYIIMCTGAGGTATDSVTVNVNSPPDPTVDIKANGSDGPITIGHEESAELTWVSTNAGSCYATGGWLGDKPLFGAETTGSLTYSKTYTINCTGPGGYAADSVTVNVEQPAEPSVDIKANGSDGPITIGYEESADLSWTSENANTCYATGSWSGDKNLSGSEFTGNLTSTRTYTIVCNGIGGTATDNVTINVEQPLAPCVDIKANGSDGPITIDYDTSAELSWTSENADACFAYSDWTGEKDVNGSEFMGNLTYTQTYTIICQGIGGTATDNVTVNVEQPNAPTVDIKANDSDGPITIDYDTSAQLTWTSENADACFAYSDWTGEKAINGSESTGNLTSSKTYLISCTGVGGYANDSVTVNIGDRPNNPPVANAGPDKETYETESIVLQGSGTDPDGDDVTYSWTCTGGSLSNSSIAQPLYHAPSVTSATTYACELTVTDPYGLSDSDSMNVLVLVHESPTLYVSFTVNPNSGCAPLQNVDLSASVYGTATGTITYFFDCQNDGNWEKVITRNDSEYTAYDLCNYNNPGNYTAKVMVERELLSVQATVPVNVENCTSAPSVDIKANGSDGPITIDYDDTANLSWTSSNANSCYAYNAWTGSKSLSGSESTDHLTSQKTYTITCTGDGGSASDSVTIRVSDEPEEGTMTVEKTARNLTDGGSWTISVSAEPNDVISFSIVVRAKDAKIYDIMVQDILPNRLIYQSGSLKVSGITSTGSIFTGLNIGDISENKKKTITYNAYVASPSSFNYGQTLLKNSVVVTSDDSDATDSDTVNIMINRIKTATAGVATGVSTGLTNNIFLDSFFIPLVIALFLIWLFKSYVLDAQDWFELRKTKYQEFQARKLLQLRIAKIKAREFVGA
jgi:hypothetical protein